MHSNSDSNDGTTETTDGANAAAERRLKVRAFISTYRTPLLIAFVLVLVLGGWVSYGAHVDPGTETERRVEEQWTATGTFTHSATVTESTAIHDVGTVLEDEPLYYTAATPEVDGAFHGGYEADRSEDVTVTLTVDLRYRAVDSEGTVYWSEREQLASTTESDVAPGELVPATFTLNVSAVTARIAEIESDLGASPGEPEIVLQLNREIEGEIDGEYRTASDRFEVQVVPEGATYRLEADAASYDDPKAETETVAVPASHGPARTVGGPLALLVGLVGVVGVRLAADRLPAPTPAEREWLAYREDRSQYADVITELRLPASALAGERAELESLAALAEFAIDVAEPVVFDRRTERYLVRRDGIVYVYDPPTLEEASAGGARPSTSADAGPVERGLRSLLGIDVESDASRADSRDEGSEAGFDADQTAITFDGARDSAPGESTETRSDDRGSDADAEDGEDGADESGASAAAEPESTATAEADPADDAATSALERVDD